MNVILLQLSATCFGHSFRWLVCNKITFINQSTFGFGLWVSIWAGSGYYLFVLHFDSLSSFFGCIVFAYSSLGSLCYFYCGWWFILCFCLFGQDSYVYSQSIYSSISFSLRPLFRDSSSATCCGHSCRWLLCTKTTHIYWSAFVGPFYKSYAYN